MTNSVAYNVYIYMEIICKNIPLPYNGNAESLGGTGADLASGAATLTNHPGLNQSKEYT